MEIKTRFDLGDEVFFMHKNKICSSIIKVYDIKVANPKDGKGDERRAITIIFKTPEESEEIINKMFCRLLNENSPKEESLDLPIKIDEDKCYSSKEELMKSL